jgi:CRP-like cAMP-binding protein
MKTSLHRRRASYGSIKVKARHGSQQHMTKVNNRGTNQLLSLLPPGDRKRILARSDKISLDIKSILYEAGGAMPYVYFPLSGMVSLVLNTQEGQTIEVGTIGNEGMAGTPLVLGADKSPVEAIIQVSGDLLRMSAKDFRVELKRSSKLRDVAQRFAQALMNQISQSVVCNRIHPVEKRICRWLLMTHDRVGLDDMGLTQQFVSQMLGVRRPSVTVVAGSLRDAGLIKYSRGKMAILNRKGLEAGACECYQIVKRESERLLAS